MIKQRKNQLISLNSAPNVRALKKSKVKKYNKIGAKIHELIKVGNETITYTEKEVQDMCEHLGFVSNVLINGNISISSKCDSWIIVDNDNYWTLYHRGTTGLNIKHAVESYHLQDVFADLEFAIVSIKSHDDYKIGKKKYFMGEIINLSYELVGLGV